MSNVKNILPTEDILTEDISVLLDELITAGTITREYAITDKLKITLKTLTVEEILEADSIYSRVGELPKDIVDRARGVSTLVYATVKINNTKIIVDDLSQTRENRIMLRERYMKFQPGLFELLYKYYLDLVKEVNDKIIVNIGDKIVNF